MKYILLIGLTRAFLDDPFDWDEFIQSKDTENEFIRFYHHKEEDVEEQKQELSQSYVQNEDPDDDPQLTAIHIEEIPTDEDTDQDNDSFSSLLQKKK